MADESIARKLAAVVAGASYADLGRATITSAKARILDALGISFASADRPALLAARRFLASLEQLPGEDATDERSPVDLFPSRTDPLSPARYGFLLGSAAFIDNYGDTSLYSVTHPNTVIVPAAITAARTRPVTGERFLTSVVAGYQVTEVLGRTLNNGTPRMAHQVRGFRPTATCGPSGVAATAGLLWQLDESMLTQAIALASNLAAGLRRTDAGDMAHMRIHSGEAVRRGIEAIFLARSGIRVDEEFIEGAGGFFEAMRGGKLDATQIRPDGLDGWFINDVAIKLHATPHTLAAGLDCLIELSRRRPDTFDVAEWVRIFLPAAHAAISLSAAQVDVSTLTPAEALDSFPFSAALVLRTGEVVLPESPQRFIDDPAVIDLARRVTVSIEAAQSAIFENDRGSWPVRVEVRLGDETVSLDRRRPRGVELDEDVLTDLRRKFDGLSAKVLGPDEQRAVEDLVFNLEDSEDVYADLHSLMPT